jgi:hypothetical protein
VTEAVCHFQWVTAGDGHHIAQLDHTCNRLTNHDGDHVCACNKTVPKNGMTLSEVADYMMERKTLRPVERAYSVCARPDVDGKVKYVHSITVDDEKKIIYLEFA